MEDIHKFIASKKIENKVELLVDDLVRKFNSLNNLSARPVAKKTDELSHDNVLLALLLFNRIDTNDPGQDYYRRTRCMVDLSTNRFLHLKNVAKPNQYWDGDRFNLLVYFFGADMAQWVKNAWDMIPGLIYQEGYRRRSFRSSNLGDIYFRLQLNLIINLIHETNYKLNFHETAKFSNYLFRDDMAYVYAAAIDGGDTDIKQLFLDAIYGRHEICKPCRRNIKALLLSNDTECWEAVEKLLLSAQRQEGLRQTVLECLDETSLGALKHFIKVILEHKLTRFSSVVRALDVWAGLGWEAEKESTIIRFLTFADVFLNNPTQIAAAIKSKDNTEIYMALWAQGVLDVMGTIPYLGELLKGDFEKQSLALFFVSQVDIPSISVTFGFPLLSSKDTVIACQAARLIDSTRCLKIITPEYKIKIFDLLEARLSDFPEKTTYSKPKVFNWLTPEYGKEIIFNLMINTLDLSNDQEIDKILPHFPHLSVIQRETVTRSILPNYFSYGTKKTESTEPLSKDKRDFAFSILKDRSDIIRNTALKALLDAELQTEELEVFEDLLKRKSADFRKSVLTLFQKQSIEKIMNSTTNLLHCKTEDQRLAGLDLLLWLKNNHSSQSEWIQQMALEYSQRGKFTSKEELLLAGLTEQKNTSKKYSQKNGFGIYNPENIFLSIDRCKHSFGVRRKHQGVNKFCYSKTIVEMNQAVQNLHHILLQNKDYEYSCESYSGSKNTVLLGNTFAALKKDTSGMTPEQRFYNYPLPEVWEKWYTDEGLTPLDLLLITFREKGYRARDYSENPEIIKPFANHIYELEMPKSNRSQVVSIINTLAIRYPYQEKIEFLSDLINDCWNDIDDATVKNYVAYETTWSKEILTWREYAIANNLWEKYASLKLKMTEEQFNVYWHQAFWRSYTSPYRSETNLLDKYTPVLYDYARAYQNQLIGKDVLLWRIMQPDSILQLTQKNRRYKEEKHITEQFPFLAELLTICRDRILEVELLRGDSSTECTILAQNIKRSYGISNFISYLKALGKDNLYRGYVYSYSNRECTKIEVFSHLLKNCYPSEESDQKAFNKLVSEAKITDKRLCEAATYAQQWLPFVSEYLGWKDMESAVWWLHAHSSEHTSEQTESEISKYTSVEQTAFKDGAVDVNWFKYSYKSLGADKWKMLYDSAKYISDGIGYNRSKLYADVILKKIKITEVTKRIVDKRNQDYLRVYGLIPLSKSNPEKDLLKRYQFLQMFIKESKQFGSQRQASEATAVKIAMENLARTAGYTDPIRLQWSMETKEAQEIVNNAQNIDLGDTIIFLEIDENGSADVKAFKDGKNLKSIPAKHRKNKEVLKLKEYSKTLKEQFKRIRKSLEIAMVNGDVFTKQEIENLMTHPVVSPMLKKLVLICENGMGFYNKGKLLSPTEKESDLNEEIKIAHCVDLYEDKNWSIYQAYCFTQQMKQPFKQIFRELYLPTADELNEKNVSRRYAGHQIQVNKTLALLKSRGWTVDYEDGLKKVNHKQNVISYMFALADWFSPADVESPTIETVEFFSKVNHKHLAFETIDKRLFSETMRDIDLIVSVAHVGEVDPEASQSSIELRITIAQETCRLFKLKNVSFSDRHAKIKGEMGEYSVHMGSGICHKVASSSLSIIPVHSQHRGRMFLPFMDEDPKTAEIISKILLLAKDKDIQDPTILQQLHQEIHY
jgi:hypothetical protein